MLQPTKRSWVGRVSMSVALLIAFWLVCRAGSCGAGAVCGDDRRRGRCAVRRPRGSVEGHGGGELLGQEACGRRRRLRGGLEAGAHLLLAWRSRARRGAPRALRAGHRGRTQGCRGATQSARRALLDGREHGFDGRGLRHARRASVSRADQSLAGKSPRDRSLVPERQPGPCIGALVLRECRVFSAEATPRPSSTCNAR